MDCNGGIANLAKKGGGGQKVTFGVSQALAMASKLSSAGS